MTKIKYMGKGCRQICEGGQQNNKICGEGSEKKIFGEGPAKFSPQPLTQDFKWNSPYEISQCNNILLHAMQCHDTIYSACNSYLPEEVGGWRAT